MAKNTLRVIAVFVCATSFLMCSCPAIQIGGLAPAAPALIEAAGHDINITGEAVGTDGYLILSDFVAAAVNSTGKRTLSDQFGAGQFTIQLNVPGFAQDNETITIQVLSPDGNTLYGNTSLKLVNSNHTSVYAVEILVANPPPNYNGLLLVIFLVVFSLILAGYILFTKWLIGQAVLKRADEIMLRRGVDQGGTDDAAEEEEAEEETVDEITVDETDQSEEEKG
jgi:hypothetical protein